MNRTLSPVFSLFQKVTTIIMAPSSDWDEIKRLAADFQKAQLTSTAQR